MSIRVLLADDHKIMREGLRALLESHAGLEVVGEASDGREAIESAKKTMPDIVVMDVGMPGLNGIEATEQIIAGSRRTKVIGLSMHSDKRFVTGMLKASASAYVLKDCAFDELIQAIQHVTNNKMFLSPMVTGIVVDKYLQLASGNMPSADDDKRRLTGRQREILQLLAEGTSTRDIAARLGLSIKTVDSHRQNIMDKLGLENIADLTRYAIREGITSLDP